MMRRALLLLAWLCLGHAAGGALYVGLINIPEANAWLLALSVLAALAVLLVLAVTDATAVQWLAWQVPFRVAIRRGTVRGLPALLLGGTLFAVAWFVSSRIDAWHAAHAGEIDAWFMATFETARTAWVHRVLRAASFVVRAVLGVSLFLAAFTAVVSGGWRDAASTRWLGAALSRRQLGAVALVMVGLVVLPWQAAAWRPRGVPPNGVEVAFVATKLTLLYVIAHVGWLVMLFVAGRETAKEAKKGSGVFSVSA